MKIISSLALASLILSAVPAVGLEKIGILTDTHVGANGDRSFNLVEHSYRLFKAKGVTHIFNLGDIANVHCTDWYRRYAAISKAVYPEGVHEVFVYHNHDRMKFPEPDDKESTKAFAAVRKALGATNDRYARFELEGIPFLVYPQFEDYARMDREIAAEVAKRPGRPVFVLEHEPPFGTTEGSVYSGRTATAKIFAKYREVVALTGHAHGSVTNELRIWQGAYTTVCFGDFQHSVGADGDAFVAILELTPARAVIRRYSVLTGKEYRPDNPWTIDFPYDPAKARYRHQVTLKRLPITPDERASFLPITTSFPIAADGVDADAGDRVRLTIDFTVRHLGDHPGRFEVHDAAHRRLVRERVPMDDGTFHYELDVRIARKGSVFPLTLTFSGSSRESLVRMNALSCVRRPMPAE